MDSQYPPSSNESAIIRLYRQLLNGWNRCSAGAFAASFTPDGVGIGFDSSQMIRQTEIASTLQQIFDNHLTAPYVNKVRDVYLLSSEVAVLRAVAGMVPPGQVDINPVVNAIQTLIAVRSDSTWRIALFRMRWLSFMADHN